jgi:hypothetical protein
MACCGKRQKPVKTVAIGEIQTWIESLGTWKYIGLCPCPDKKKMFVSDTFKNWAIYISQNGGTMEVRQVLGRDHKIKAIANIYNYKQIYNHWVK